MTSSPISSKKTFTGSPLTTMSFIDPVKDLIEHVEAATNIWYLAGRLEGNSHQFGFLTYQVTLPQSVCTVGNSLIDLTTGWYRAEESTYPREAVSLPKTGLSLRTPTARVTGPFEEWSVHLTVPGGEAALTLRPVGGVLYSAGPGLFPYLGHSTFQYALPTLETTGTVVANDGQTYQVSGVTWFDRQWGGDVENPHQFFLAATWRFTWFGLNLDNGDLISLWDIIDNEKEQSFATVLHPDGSQTIAPVTPVVQDASDFWVSPSTGSRYPTHWIIRIPTLDAELEVSVQARRDQEMPSSAMSTYSGACSVKGTYRGQPTSGHARVDMIGTWK